MILASDERAFVTGSEVFIDGGIAQTSSVSNGS
ncbi:hypothetical protein [Paraburkholderia terrae]